ncbi:MAG TPA: hypothetical protein PLT00_01710 [Verrucomicrobiota bacterium]|nr:hypothetical protein [Verrucomicrobiota bacterium]HQB15412.1 hypothetical protein [Verrucomicrobiota bacterium]
MKNYPDQELAGSHPFMLGPTDDTDARRWEAGKIRGIGVIGGLGLPVIGRRVFFHDRAGRDAQRAAWPFYAPVMDGWKVEQMAGDAPSAPPPA